jgi:hypothetical protein
MIKIFSIIIEEYGFAEMPKCRVGLNLLDSFKCYISNIQRAGMT